MRERSPRPGPHDARRAVHRRADPGLVLDPAAVHRGDDLGDDARRRHLAGAALVRGAALEAARPGRAGDDAADAAALRRAADAGHRHVVEHSDAIVRHAKSLAGYQVPPPPEWVASLPFVGDKLVQTLGAGGCRRRRGPDRASSYPMRTTSSKWFVSQAGSFGFVFLQFLLTVAISALMYAGGEPAALALLRFGRRLAGRTARAR